MFNALYPTLHLHFLGCGPDPQALIFLVKDIEFSLKKYIITIYDDMRL